MAIAGTFTPPGDKQPFNITDDGLYLLKKVGPKHSAKDFMTVYVTGTWGAGTLQVQASPDGAEANAINIADASLTDDGYINISIKSDGLFIDLSGSTGADLNIWVL